MNLNELIKELVMDLRANITDPKNRGSTKTDVFSGDDNTTTFTLSELGVKTITLVKVDGVTKTYGTDYTVDLKEEDPSQYPTVTFTTAPPTGTDNVEVTFKYGETWVYPDYPRTDLSLNKYPRLALVELASNSTPSSLWENKIVTQFYFDVIAYADKAYTVRKILNEVKERILNHGKSFYTVDNVIQPVGLGPLGAEPNRADKILSQNLTIRVYHQEEE